MDVQVHYARHKNAITAIDDPGTVRLRALGVAVDAGDPSVFDHDHGIGYRLSPLPSINRPPVSISVSDMESSPVMNSGFK